jgi:NAD(P)-dependent dehydrogenase (short-subunit alcohol dehydrogenase family)
VSERLAGKVALVTGAAQGIGRDLALGLAAHGAVVHVADRDAPTETLAALDAEHRGLALGADIADRAAVGSLFATLDRLDILVNCAGITGWVDVANPAEDVWDAVVATNLKGTFFCSTEAAGLMRAAGGGSIINISSVVAARGHHGLSAYGATKGGINALTIQLASEFAADGIRVNAVAPGATNVPRNIADESRYAEIWAERIPLGRAAETDDIVGPVLFFASPDSAYVTGQVLYVDGGWTVVGDLPDAYRERIPGQ